MGMVPLGLTEFDNMIRSELLAEIDRLRRHIADIGEAMRTKANNNPAGVKASTLEMLGNELLAALPSNATSHRPPAGGPVD